MAEKLDIFLVLKNIEKRNFLFYRNLSSEQKKQFAPFVVAKWMSSTNDKDMIEYYIHSINLILNPYIWDFSSHKELLWMLFCCIGTGTNVRHGWIPVEKKGTEKTKLLQLLSSHKPDYNHQELELFSKKIDKQYLNNLMDYRELTKEQRKDILNEYDRH